MLQDKYPFSQLTVSQGEPLAWGRRTYVMGIINVTPDSFSGDGLGSDIPAIVEQARRFQAEGADILDVGAESTRPGSSPVGVSEELVRLIPALEAIRSRVDLPISVDTYKSEVALRAVEAGAGIINDVWGLKADPGIARVAADSGAGLVIMHNGRPRPPGRPVETSNPAGRAGWQENRRYQDLLPDILASLSRSIGIAREAGVAEEQIIVDPGIGFGKTPEHNLEVLRRLDEFKALGYPLLVGASRKSTIGLVLDLPADQRMVGWAGGLVEGTAATVALSIAGGADIVRVHDVKEMVRVCRMSDAVLRGWRPPNWPDGGVGRRHQ